MCADVRARAENRPGVYRMLSSAGEVVYVGKSKRLRARLLSYFRCAFPEEKGARILREADRIEWEYAPSEFAAIDVLMPEQPNDTSSCTRQLSRQLPPRPP